jgi:hypothetical protein
LSDFATRSSNTCSSLSQVPAAFLLSRAICALAALPVRVWTASPSFTSESNILPPSDCALAKAPSPASQIW